MRWVFWVFQSESGHLASRPAAPSSISARLAASYPVDSRYTTREDKRTELGQGQEGLPPWRGGSAPSPTYNAKMGLVRGVPYVVQTPPAGAEHCTTTLPQACAWGYTQAPLSGLQEEDLDSETDSEIQGACAWGYNQTLAKRELRTENIRDEIRTCT